MSSGSSGKGKGGGKGQHPVKVSRRRRQDAADEQAEPSGVGKRDEIAGALAEQFGAHEKLLRALVAQPPAGGDDLVHDFRVSTRQLLASLSMVATVSQPDGDDMRALDDLRRKLKKPFKALGPVRDLEVALEHLSDLSAQENTLGPLLDWVREEHANQAREVMADVAGRRAPKATKALARHKEGVLKLIGAVDEGALGGRLARELLHSQRQARACWNDLRTNRAATFHELRIALKHLRYQSAFIASLSGAHAKLAKSVVTDCRALQQQLGEIQDLTVLLQMARAHAATKSRALRTLKQRRQERMLAVVEARPTLIEALVRARALAAALRMERRHAAKL